MPQAAAGDTVPCDYLERFLRQAGTITWDESALAGARLDSRTARILHVGAQLEDDTAITVRQGRTLGIERSSDIAVFLPLWDVEEAEHGKALHALLAHQRYEVPVAAPQRISRRRRAIARIPAPVFGRFPHTAFLFCVLGAAAEYLAMVTYTEIIKRTDNEAAASLLRDITRQEARHFAFLLAAAQDRAGRLSPLQGRIARRVLRSLWEPIGVPSLGRAVWDDLFANWIADPPFADRLRMMDRVVDSIPHLGDLRLMERFLAGSASPTPARAGCRANPPR